MSYINPPTITQIEYGWVRRQAQLDSEAGNPPDPLTYIAEFHHAIDLYLRDEVLRHLSELITQAHELLPSKPAQRHTTLNVIAILHQRVEQLYATEYSDKTLSLIHLIQERNPQHADTVAPKRPGIPVGLCGNRDDHVPHIMKYAPVANGPMVCHAQQHRRVPFAIPQP